MYLEQFSLEKSIKKNLLDCIFDKNAMLFEEPSNLSAISIQNNHIGLIISNRIDTLHLRHIL